MQRIHADELSELGDTYLDVRNRDLPALREAISELATTHAVYIGSGGMLAVAQLAADLHCAATGQLAVAATPIQAASGPLASDSAVVLLSARARHPDVLATARAARRRSDRSVLLFTQRIERDLDPNLRQAVDTVVTIPSPHSDGFLATNSIVAFATAICGAYGAALPENLPSLTADPSRPSGWDSPRWLVTYAPGLAAVAVDLEARLSETGIRDIQVADLRNLAHGRHVGLSRMLDRTLLIPVTGPEGRSLSQRTLRLLPKEVRIHALTTELPFPAGTVDLMVAGMQLAGVRAADDRYDVGRPSVPAWGRRLYHLRWSPKVPTPWPPSTERLKTSEDRPLPRPIAMKMRAAGVAPGDVAVSDWYRSALDNWLNERATEKIGGIVLDYDGTCCDTASRFNPPPAEVQEEILSLLEAGLLFGFASGRGRSLIHGAEGLRTWIPSRYWPDVNIGLYNGAIRLRLSDDVPEQTECLGDLATAADLLDGHSAVFGWTVDRRLNQITVEARDTALYGGKGMIELVQSLLSREHMGRLKLVASAHSVDILLSDTTKRSVLNTVGQVVRDRRGSRSAVLAIGDAGHFGGNDFELLSATSNSLSVERCSPDPDRCWNLGLGEETGPQLLTRYLDAVQIQEHGAGKFEWRRQRSS